MSQTLPRKWNLPGWRIEQRYAPGVLIGNWAEERNTFQKGQMPHNSTHRCDFQHYGTYSPDVTIRRKAKFRTAGLGKDYLFVHHGNRYSNNMISWYDEHYNKRERDEQNKLPELRHFDCHSLAWLPEKSDHPIEGDGTRFGLLEKQRGKWAAQIADQTHGDYNTTYVKSYSGLPANSAVTRRYATPRQHSSHLHRVNSTNKDLRLRSKPHLQTTEVMCNNSSLIACQY